MTHKRCLLLRSLLAAWVISIPACGGSGKESDEKNIPYEVLKEEKRPVDGKLFLEVLVGEAASKQDVMKLAESLRRKHDGKFAEILIFDSREAWQHLPGMQLAVSQDRIYKAYTEKELGLHWLVVIAGDLGQEIRWVAEGRDEPKVDLPKKSDVIKKQDEPKPLTTNEKKNLMAKNQFVGRWQIIDSTGQTVTNVTLIQSLDARKSNAPDATGKWTVVEDEARIIWSDGYRTIIRPQAGSFLLISFGPGRSWDDKPPKPTITLRAIKQPEK